MAVVPQKSAQNKLQEKDFASPKAHGLPPLVIAPPPGVPINMSVCLRMQRVLQEGATSVVHQVLPMVV